VLCPCDNFRTGVRLGEYDIDSDIDCMNEEGEEVCAESHVDFDVEQSISHPRYSLSHLQNDIGLIRIKGTANFKSGECQVYFLYIHKPAEWLLISLHLFICLSTCIMK
jgi:hypothetical protein